MNYAAAGEQTKFNAVTDSLLEGLSVLLAPYRFLRAGFGGLGWRGALTGIESEVLSHISQVPGNKPWF